ncbi:MAG: hypothetical protein JO368_08705 [Acidimicrobiales bacterium]|nr:hypothetical protein [Acidimicrobiales bacterium]
MIFSRQIRSGTAHTLAGTPAGRLVLHQMPQAMTAVSHGTVRATAAALPPAAGQALLGAFRASFAATFDHLMVVATVVAAVGAVGSLALVRQRDFVPSVNPADAARAPRLELADDAPPVTDGGAPAPVGAGRGRPKAATPHPGG